MDGFLVFLICRRCRYKHNTRRLPSDQWPLGNQVCVWRLYQILTHQYYRFTSLLYNSKIVTLYRTHKEFSSPFFWKRTRHLSGPPHLLGLLQERFEFKSPKVQLFSMRFALRQEL